jgi:hypothetical protein
MLTYLRWELVNELKMGPPRVAKLSYVYDITENKSGSPLDLHDKPWSDLARTEMSPV